MEKIGRNQPCPCGSGMKYKKCCLHNPVQLNRRIVEASAKRAQKRYEQTFGEKPKLAEHIDIKISDAIISLADDFLQETETVTDYELLVALTCAAWNIALFPRNFEWELERFFEPEEIESLLDLIPEYVPIIIMRKQQIYPDNEHYIIDFDLVKIQSGFYINITSSLPEKEASTS